MRRRGRNRSGDQGELLRTVVADVDLGEVTRVESVGETTCKTDHLIRNRAEDVFLLIALEEQHACHIVNVVECAVVVDLSLQVHEPTANVGTRESELTVVFRVTLHDKHGAVVTTGMEIIEITAKFLLPMVNS